MATAEKTKIVHTPHSLVGRTARAMFDAAHDDVEKTSSFLVISQTERERYERMACAALGVALTEPVTA